MEFRCKILKIIKEGDDSLSAVNCLFNPLTHGNLIPEAFAVIILFIFNDLEKKK